MDRLESISVEYDPMEDVARYVGRFLNGEYCIVKIELILRVDMEQNK